MDSKGKKVPFPGVTRIEEITDLQDEGFEEFIKILRENLPTSKDFDTTQLRQLIPWKLTSHSGPPCGPTFNSCRPTFA